MILKERFIPFVSSHRKLLAAIAWSCVMAVLLIVTIFSGRGNAQEADRNFGSEATFTIEDLEKNYCTSLEKTVLAP